MCPWVPESGTWRWGHIEGNFFRHQQQILSRYKITSRLWQITEVREKRTIFFARYISSLRIKDCTCLCSSSWCSELLNRCFTSPTRNLDWPEAFWKNCVYRFTTSATETALLDAYVNVDCDEYHIGQTPTRPKSRTPIWNEDYEVCWFFLHIRYCFHNEFFHSIFFFVVPAPGTGLSLFCA